MAQERQSGFLFNDQGPVLAELSVRPSATQPSRLKVGFVIQLDQSTKLIAPAGEEIAVPSDHDGQQMLCGSEFRIELN